MIKTPAAGRELLAVIEGLLAVPELFKNMPLSHSSLIHAARRYRKANGMEVIEYEKTLDRVRQEMA